MKKISLTFAVLFLIFGVVSAIGGQYLGVGQKQVTGMTVINIVVSGIFMFLYRDLSADKNHSNL